MPQKRTMVSLLTSWKEIANYLGKGVRTVQRWERELGLPVRRTGNDSSKCVVLAIPEEIDAWVRAQHFRGRNPKFHELELAKLRAEVAALRSENAALRQLLKIR